jgi:hypothetical protein
MALQGAVVKRKASPDNHFQALKQAAQNSDMDALKSLLATKFGSPSILMKRLRGIQYSQSQEVKICPSVHLAL